MPLKKITHDKLFLKKWGHKRANNYFKVAQECSMQSNLSSWSRVNLRHTKHISDCQNIEF